jgi:hypothetical protein
MERENARLIALRDTLIDGLLQISKSRLNGHPDKRLPNNANISFLDIEGEAAALYLDAEGIQVSTVPRALLARSILRTLFSRWDCPTRRHMDPCALPLVTPQRQRISPL